MKYNLLIQFVDRNYSDYDIKEIENLENAIFEFNNFDWKKQWKKIKNRENQNLTSSSPTLIFQNTEINEKLYIESLSESDFNVSYELNNKYGTDFVSEDITQNPNGSSVPDYIVGFFDNQLEAKFELQYLKEEDDKIISLGKYKPFKYFSIFILFLISISFFIFALYFNITQQKFDIINFIPFLVFFIFSIIPFSIVIQYLSKPKIKSVNFNTKTRILEIDFSNEQVNINVNEIIQCVYTYSSDHRAFLTNFANIVITTKNGNQYFLTSISFKLDELSQIINLLNINIYKFDKKILFLNSTKFFEKIEIAKEQITDNKELEIMYSNYSIKILEEIIENHDDYQPNAVIIARNELTKRKQI